MRSSTWNYLSGDSVAAEWVKNLHEYFLQKKGSMVSMTEKAAMAFQCDILIHYNLQEQALVVAKIQAGLSN